MDRWRYFLSDPLQWLLVPIVGSSAGLLYAMVSSIDVIPSAVRGVFIGTPIILYERETILKRCRTEIRKAATPIAIVTTIAIYGLMIVIGNAVAGTALHHSIGYMSTAREAMVMTETGFFYSLGVAALIAFVLRVRDLIGPSLFTSLLLGRYHRPTKEELIFLFLDVTGSTQFAIRYGDLKTQAYLGQIFNALALPVRRSKGSIDDYIGDMAIVTWNMRNGLRDAACLRCVFDFAANINDQAATWQAEFGQVPGFRAVLHCGWVVTAEVGLERHKIAYFGDVVNTMGRLEDLSKALEVSVMVSADLLAAIDGVPQHLKAEDLGYHIIRGRDKPLQVSAVRLR